jgi:heme iron utilization protein
MKRAGISRPPHDREWLTLERLRAFDSEPFAVLATEDRHGPYASLVAHAFTTEGNRILLATPRTSRKYRNLVTNRKVALLIDRRPKSSGAGLMEAEAVTIAGEATPIRRGGSWNTLAGIYLEKHPHLAEFLEAKSTALVAVVITEAVYVSRFQEVSLWSSTAEAGNNYERSH